MNRTESDMDFEVGEFYKNQVGNPAKCLEATDDEVKMWILMEIPEEEQFVTEREDGERELAENISAVVAFDPKKNGDHYSPIRHEKEVERLEKIHQRITNDEYADKLNELHQELEILDREFGEDDVPLQQRPLKAFNKLRPDGEVMFGPDQMEDTWGEFEGPNHFEKITDWFEERYGDEMKMNPVIGEKPIKVRGHIYFIKCPLVYGEVEINPLEYVENLTKKLMWDLSDHELQEINEHFQLAYETHNNLNGLRDSKSFSSADSRGMFNRCVANLNAAVSVFKDQRDLQGTLFQCQQAVEKSMKTFLMEEAHFTAETIRDEFGHNLNKLYQATQEIDGGFSQFSGDVNSVKVDMNIRYEETPHGEKDALRGIDSMFRICEWITGEFLSERKFSED